jgi:hypothetical protein
VAKIKTAKTEVDVNDFIESVPDGRRKAEAIELLRIYSETTGLEPYMYGPSIIGFGNYHYKYKTGHEGDAPIAGFSPRKSALTLYFSDFPGRDEMLEKLGDNKAYVSCVYVKRLTDISIPVLRKMIKASAKYILEVYPG